MPSFRAFNLQTALVCFNNFLAHGEPQTEADVASGKEWFRRLGGCLGGKSGAIVLDRDVDPVPAGRVRRSIGFDVDPGVIWIRLNGIQHDLEQCMFESWRVARQNNGLILFLITQTR